MLMTSLVFVMTAIGLLVTSLVLPRSTTLALLVVGGAIAGAAHAHLASRQGRSDCPEWLAYVVTLRPTRMWHSALYGAMVLSAFAGLATSMGPIVASLVIVLTVAVVAGRYPAVRLRVDTVALLRPAIAVADVDPVPTAFAPTWVVAASPADGDLAGWSDDALCWAWRTSYVRMQRDGRHRIAAIAIERLSYLDEFERRNPAGFNAWLAAGARAPSDPTRYLISPGQTPPGADVNRADPAAPADAPGSKSPPSLPMPDIETGGAPS